MNKGLTKDVYLYFNTQANNDNIATSTNGCFPAKNLVNMGPTGDSELTLYFKSMINADTKGGAEAVVHDTVALTLATANSHFDTMKAIVRQINDTRPTFGGFIDVVDDHTIIVGGAAASRTVATGLTSGAGATSLAGAGIANCGAIATVAANTGVHIHATTVLATSDGAGTGTIPRGGFYTVDVTNANHIVILPAPVPGTIVYLNSSAETGQAYELRSSAPGSVAINGGTGSNVESAIATGTSLVVCVCVSATAWIANSYANAGTEAAVAAAA